MESVGVREVWAILVELLGPWLWAAFGLAAVWLVAVGIAFLRGAAWRRALWPSVIVGLATGLVGLAIIPSLTGASFQDLTSVVDWFILGLVSLGLAADVTLLLWPFLALWFARPLRR